MDLPLNLKILRLVQDFGKIPRGLLYDKVPASNNEIDKQVTELENKGIIKVDGDVIIPIEK
jgi:DNA-binding Lrp family transcriptional regulator